MNGSSLLPPAPPTPRGCPISVARGAPPQPERLSSRSPQAADPGLFWASVFAHGEARAGLGKVDQKTAAEDLGMRDSCLGTKFLGVEMWSRRREALRWASPWPPGLLTLGGEVTQGRARTGQGLKKKKKRIHNSGPGSRSKGSVHLISKHEQAG